MENQATAGYAAFIPLIIMMIPLIFICRQLAKDKGKNTLKYTILGCIPLVNYYALIYLVGTPNRMVEEKLDRVLAMIDKTNRPMSN
jgi:hypothetical protein